MCTGHSERGGQEVEGRWSGLPAKDHRARQVWPELWVIEKTDPYLSLGQNWLELTQKRKALEGFREEASK